MAISILVHILFIVSPVEFALKRSSEIKPFSTVSVGLVDLPQQIQHLPKKEPMESKEPTAAKSDSEGISFQSESGAGGAYLDKLKVKIFNIWQYPEEAIRKGEQGKVTISFVLNEKGEVGEMSVLDSSGSKSLDSAAMAAIKSAGPYGLFTPDIKDKTMKVKGNLRYVLD